MHSLPLLYYAIHAITHNAHKMYTTYSVLPIPLVVRYAWGVMLLVHSPGGGPDMVPVSSVHQKERSELSPFTTRGTMYFYTYILNSPPPIYFSQIFTAPSLSV
jgi:hypothetical protein